MKTLRLGNTGPEVQRLREALRDNLYIVSDGQEFDSVLQDKVKKFQQHKGLISDGVVGPATWRALGVSTPWLRDNSELLNVVQQAVKTGSLLDKSSSATAVLQSYNKFNGLVEQLSKTLQIDPAALHSVIAVESSGVGMKDNRMIIRFENHIFWRKWGKYHEEDFKRWFYFNPDKPWTNHTFNGAVLHNGSQDREWEAFDKARSFMYSETPAIESISMGLGQLMGFHWKVLGFNSALDMLNSQSTSERIQLLTMFDFIKLNPTMLTALQELDWWTFAYHYNGSGQTDIYSQWLAERYSLANQISTT